MIIIWKFEVPLLGFKPFVHIIYFLSSNLHQYCQMFWKFPNANKGQDDGWTQWEFYYLL